MTEDLKNAAQDVFYMDMSRPALWGGSNPWLYGAALVCAVFWLVVAAAGVKLTDIYQVRGHLGFRHAVAVRVDHRIGQLAGIVAE